MTGSLPRITWEGKSITYSPFCAMLSYKTKVPTIFTSPFWVENQFRFVVKRLPTADAGEGLRQFSNRWSCQDPAQLPDNDSWSLIGRIIRLLLASRQFRCLADSLDKFNHVAKMLGEDPELLEAIVCNHDNLSYGSLISVYDGTGAHARRSTNDWKRFPRRLRQTQTSSHASKRNLRDNNRALTQDHTAASCSARSRCCS
nr:hypothetical protein [Mesorhizobium sp. L2C066B000]